MNEQGRRRAAAWALAATAGIAAVAVAGAAGGSATVVEAGGPMTVFENPYQDGSPNPADGAVATVRSVTTGSGRTIVTLHVRGVTPDREFGAHVHKLGCASEKGGGHYQNVGGTPATDPAYANPDNEIWLDFTTNPDGRGRAQANVEWTIRSGEARSVVIHDHGTSAAPPAGVAGPKLACLDVDF